MHIYVHRGQICQEMSTDEHKLYVDKSQICQEMETNEHSHIHWSKMNRSSQELYNTRHREY